MKLLRGNLVQSLKLFEIEIDLFTETLINDNQKYKINKFYPIASRVENSQKLSKVHKIKQISEP
ncbi:MAG: hypothetical protein L3J74_06505 [Bacteroidales bacterium]|nr:hypothetical protein [Bacteroidales bacterium]